jgi:asparagine synthetase B (glutamine-hydrolysing)
MAGIAGIQGTDSGYLDLMLERIKYRGPHETWTNREGDVIVGCNELNMGADCKDGSHHASNGKKAVVLDGRVYNAAKGKLMPRLYLPYMISMERSLPGR